MIDLLLILLRPALMVVEGGNRNPVFVILAFIAFFVDILIANTTFRLIAGRGPRNGEVTVSDMLENLCLEVDHPDNRLFIEVAKKINKISPTGMHIKAAT